MLITSIAVAADGRQAADVTFTSRQQPQEFDPAPRRLDDTIGKICASAMLGVAASDRPRRTLLMGIADHQKHVRALFASANRKIERDNRPDVRTAGRGSNKGQVRACRTAS